MNKHIAKALSAVLAAGLMAGCGQKTAPSIPPKEPAGDIEYVYGTARLTWAQFWANEGISYDPALDFDAVNEITDAEGAADLGGFDAVTRATQKHGVYRGSQHYSNLLHAVDEKGKEISVYLDELTDAADVADHFGTGSVFYGLPDGTYALAQHDGDAEIYTIVGVDVTGYRNWPVRIPADQAAEAAEAVDFVPDEEVTADTGLLKTVTVDKGIVTAFAAAPAQGEPVEYSGEISVSYDDQYGDYILVQFRDCPEDWGQNLLGASYAYFGDVNPEEVPDAAPVAVYGTKYAADTWWKAGGTLLQFGMNTSHRQGGGEQYGYWQITVIAAGYENYTATILALPRYPGEITATLGTDNATLTIDGIADADWNNTVVAVDGIPVEMGQGQAFLGEQAIGAHEVTVSTEGYRDCTLEVIAMSDLTPGDITLEGNVLKVNGDLQNYLSNITGIAVGEATLSGEDLGSIVFGEDGVVDFSAEIPGKRGATVVFPNSSEESYVLIITAAGYPNVVLTTEAIG